MSYLISRLPQGGIYFFQLIDHYAASISIMFLAFFEVIAISWLYGVRRLCNNVKEMTGHLPSMYFRFCWFFAAPLLIMVCKALDEYYNKILVFKRNRNYVSEEKTIFETNDRIEWNATKHGTRIKDEQLFARN